MTSQKVPESITHAQYLEASKPLLDLLGLTDQELFTNGTLYTHVSREGGAKGRQSATVGLLHLTFAARKVDDERRRPLTMSAEGLEPRPHETAELAWRCVVKVTR